VKTTSNLLIYLFFFLVPATFAFAEFQPAEQNPGIKIDVCRIVGFKEVQPGSLIGLRTQGKIAFVFFRNGSGNSINLEDGEVKPLPSFEKPIIDFALNDGKPVGLTEEGLLIGVAESSWPQMSFQACRVDICAGEALLTGGTRAVFLGRNATQAVFIDNLVFGSPFRDGFIWALRRNPIGHIWQAELLDMFGNKMKRIYRFSRDFDPSGLKLGPIGPEGELAVSFWNGRKRELAVIGQNGRMLLRIAIPSPICERDFAWDHEGKLLILEREGNKIILKRWKIDLPEV